MASAKIGIDAASMARATNRWALFGEFQQDLVRLQLAGLDPQGDAAGAVIDKGFARIGQWRSRSLLETMAQRRTDAFQRFAEITPGELARATLSGGDALIHYVDGLDRLYAYSVTGEAVRWHDLGERAEIQAQVERFLDGISRPEALATPAVVAEDGSALYAVLMEPVLASAPTLTRLAVVPTPSLASLPFDALVVDASEHPTGFGDVEFLMDRYQVSYMPSAPVMGLLASLPPREARRTSLVLADPDYETAAQGVAPASTPRLARLPGTRGEALAIARILIERPDDDRIVSLEEARDVRVDLGGVEVALGREASTAVLRRDLSQYSVLHFATHGVINEGDARRSGLAMSPGAGDDGFLSVDEISKLQLDADLAVLSACDTARGEVRRGEGVQSMARALMYAGARSVVASLWQVDDRETQRIMSAFYASRESADIPDAAALRTARLGVRRSAFGDEGFVGLGRGGALGGSPRKQVLTGRQLVGHPYFWAPFVYVGLPR